MLQEKESTRRLSTTRVKRLDHLLQTGNVTVRPVQIISAPDGMHIRYRYFVHVEEKQGRLPALEAVVELEMHPQHGLALRLLECKWKGKPLPDAQTLFQNLLLRLVEKYLRSLVQAAAWREDQWLRQELN